MISLEKTVLALLLISLSFSLHIRQYNHDYWFLGFKKVAQAGIPYTDQSWNYCDYKCTSLEKLSPGIDFYVITFNLTDYTPSFSACYGKNMSEVKLWNNFIQNNFFEQLCGGDPLDYLTTGTYTKINEQGVGIGTLFNY